MCIETNNIVFQNNLGEVHKYLNKISKRFYLCKILVVFVETGSHYAAQDVLELTERSTCLCFSSTNIKGVHHTPPILNILSHISFTAMCGIKFSISNKCLL